MNDVNNQSQFTEFDFFSILLACLWLILNENKRAMLNVHDEIILERLKIWKIKLNLFVYTLAPSQYGKQVKHLAFFMIKINRLYINNK